MPSLRPHCLCQLMGMSWLPSPQALGVRATFSISSQCVLETMHTAPTPTTVLSARRCLQPHWGLDYSAGVEDVSKQQGGPLGLSFPLSEEQEQVVMGECRYGLGRLLKGWLHPSPEGSLPAQ